jgi:F-type H+-transporting ATPase subunit gamma
MKAMELVAASKMRKATQLVMGTRPFVDGITRMSDELHPYIDPAEYPLLAGIPADPDVPAQGLPTLLVIIASDRGLCGGFNSQLLKKTMEFVRTRDKNDLKIMTVGRRAEQVVRRAELDIVASFESLSNAPSFERAKPMLQHILKEFTEGRVKRVFVAYTDFKSALNQVPTVHQLLPIIPEEELSMIKIEGDEGDSHEEADALVEPSRDQLMAELLPKMVEMQSYRAFLESAASEHAARMMAMRSAGDAAGEMLDTLTFTLNQARQASITQEISEISAGKAALE